MDRLRKTSSEGNVGTTNKRRKRIHSEAIHLFLNYKIILYLAWELDSESHVVMMFEWDVSSTTVDHVAKGILNKWFYFAETELISQKRNDDSLVLFPRVIDHH